MWFRAHRTFILLILKLAEGLCWAKNIHGKRNNLISCNKCILSVGRLKVWILTVTEAKELNMAVLSWWKGWLWWALSITQTLENGGCLWAHVCGRGQTALSSVFYCVLKLFISRSPKKKKSQKCQMSSHIMCKACNILHTLFGMCCQDRQERAG